MSDSRRRRWGTLLFGLAWGGALWLGLRVGCTAFDTNPEHLTGLLGLAYMAAWGPFFALSRLDPVGKAARFALCTFSIASTFAVLEVPALLRIVDYRTVFTTPTPPWQRSGNRPDPDLIYVRQGHQRTRFRYDGAELYGLRGAKPWQRYNCELALDANGFRNPTDADSTYVVVVGDSFVEGLHVEAPELMTARLAEKLGQTVTNLGRTGYGPQQERNVLVRHGLNLGPKTCVWAFYEGNDLQDLHEFDANQKNLKWILDDRRSSSFYSRCFVRNSLGFAVRNWLRPDPTRPAASYAGRFTDRAGKDVEIYFSTGIQHGAGGPELPRGDSDELKRVRAILAEAHELCAARGIELVVAFIPAKFRVYHDLCRFAADSPCRDWPIDDLPDVMARTVAAISPEIGYVDLSGPLRAAARSGGLVYLPDDTHWSAEGHEVAAQAIAGRLAGRPSPRDAVESRRGLTQR
ncbi:MAG: hypothetical protein P4L85_07865 [Paludisphaera borealis]|uniref:alginate O-acetyltransferase AlgX-related protein n=1 Tax=Paludisphaera borealis TaxID=1387353 RepID=UPI00284D5400|nr:hypothetical protein [Paludisphaera borealis]MDR3619250.1 hypothetical protein [Paludisphaera borealis]